MGCKEFAEQIRKRFPFAGSLVRIAVSSNGFYIYARFSAGGPVSTTVRTLELRPSEAQDLLRQLSWVLTKNAQNDPEEGERGKLAERQDDDR